MSGSILGKDQIDKANAAYYKVYDHIKGLIKKASTPLEMTMVHFLVEHCDTPELSDLFRTYMPFLSPAERKAMVRLAIFDVLMAKEVKPTEIPNTDNAGVKISEPIQLKVYTPPQFNLNVNRAVVTEQAKVAPVEQTPAYKPAVTLDQTTAPVIPKGSTAIKLNVATTESHQVD